MAKGMTECPLSKYSSVNRQKNERNQFNDAEQLSKIFEWLSLAKTSSCSILLSSNFITRRIDMNEFIKTEKELKKAIKDLLFSNNDDMVDNYKLVELPSLIGRKVDVNYENCDIETNFLTEDDSDCEPFITNGINGFGTLKLDDGTEIAYCGYSCGGDWQIPVNVIIVGNDETLFNVFPVEGNIYNHETNSAYTNENADENGWWKDEGFPNSHVDREKELASVKRILQKIVETDRFFEEMGW